MERKDWLVATIGAAGAAGLTPVQLQKSLFLAARRARPDALPSGFYDFYPYDYGPFCPQVYDDANDLAAAGVVRVDRLSPRRYVLVSQQAAERAANELGAHADFVLKTVRWVTSLSFSDLVRAIYKIYPDMRVKSVFRG